MKDVAQEDKTLALWTMWLSVCGLCFFVVFCGFQILSLIKCCPKPATLKEQSEKPVQEKSSAGKVEVQLEYDPAIPKQQSEKPTQGLWLKVFDKSTMFVRKPEQVDDKVSEARSELVIETHMTSLFKYLRWCVFKPGGFQARPCALR